MVEWFLDYEMDIKWKELVVLYFKVLSQNLPGRTDENHENLSNDSRSSGRDSNTGTKE